MFDTISITPARTEYVPYCREEKRAPTDESIKIYEEMLEKARASVIDAFNVESNTFNGQIVVCEEPMMREVLVHYKFSLNGKEYNGMVREPSVNYTNDKGKIIRALFLKVADRISQSLFKMIPTSTIKQLTR